MRSCRAAASKAICAMLVLLLIAFFPATLGHPSGSRAGGASVSSPTARPEGTLGTSGIGGLSPQSTLDSRVRGLAPAESNVYATDPYEFHTHQPAPMGIADYGVTNAGEDPYYYYTPAVQGIVALEKNVSVANATLGTLSPTFATQLNVMFVFNNAAGSQFTYWVQDVAQYNTSTGEIYRFVDNIWNDTASGASMNPSTVTGNGTLLEASGGSYLYADVSNPALPGSRDAPVTAGESYSVQMDAIQTTSGAAGVEFLYSDGSGWVSYDQAIFPWAANLEHFFGFVVDGQVLNYVGIPYDLELTFGGPGGGSQTTDVFSDLDLRLLYFNGHNWQSPENAFNFGTETAEGSQQVEALPAYSDIDGNVSTLLFNGSSQDSTVGRLFNVSQIGILNFTDPSVSGDILVNGRPTPFSGGAATLVLWPGTYDVNLSVNGQMTVLGMCRSVAGKTDVVTPASPCPSGTVPPPTGSGGVSNLGWLYVLLALIVVVIVVAIVLVLLFRRRSGIPPPTSPYPPQFYSPTGVPPGVIGGSPSAGPPAAGVAAPTYYPPPPAGGSWLVPPPSPVYAPPVYPAAASPPMSPPPAVVSPPVAIPYRSCPRCGTPAAHGTVQCLRCGAYLPPG
ncbi:MAG: thermopsin [Thermoplasmata archaeon]